MRTASLHAYAIMMAMLVIMAGCTDGFRSVPAESSGGESVAMRFSVSGNLRTRSDGSDTQRCPIDHVYILLFTNRDDDLESRFVSYTRAGISEDDSEVLSFRIPYGIAEGELYRALAVANADFYPPEGYDTYERFLSSLIYQEGGDISLEEFKRRLRLHHPSFMTDDDNPFLPMHGELTADSPFSFFTDEEGCHVSGGLELSHSVCRIEVINNAVSDILIAGVMPCNVRDTYLPFDPGSDIGNVVGLPSADGFIPVNETAGGLVQSSRDGIYCFPNRVDDCGRDDDRTTALLISALYRDPATHVPDATPSYYRVNILTDGKSQRMSANFIYRISISEVTGRGKPTPEEAYGTSTSENSILTSSDPNVKIKGDTIAIQAFHPEIFNSFISAPICIDASHPSLGIPEQVRAGLTYDVSCPGLQWPLEGAVGSMEATGIYHSGSFDAAGAAEPKLPEGFRTEGLDVSEPFYVSAGCTAPDDPDIIHPLSVTIYSQGSEVHLDFILRIYSEPAIMDDVVVEGLDGSHYLICDRNVQLLSNYGGKLNDPPFSDISPTESGKPQAWHYCSCPLLMVPFKDGVESSLHPSSRGYLFTKAYADKDYGSMMLKDWREIFKAVPVECSPFYTSEKIMDWTCPPAEEISRTWPRKLCVSKMRFFFVSDVPAADGTPVCCYLPFHIYNSANATPSYFPIKSETLPGNKVYTTGYMSDKMLSAVSNGNADNWFFYCQTADRLPADGVHAATAHADAVSMVRLIRPLTEKELEDYKRDYLGYYGGKLRLKPCRKDSSR